MSATNWAEWLARIEAKIDKLLAAKSGTAPSVADDADLDGQWGDPEVRKDPKRWDGESMVGKRYSETSPEFLRVLADFLLWQAGRDEQKTDDEKAVKYAAYKRRDASRALGWAARLESGWKPKPNPLRKADEDEARSADAEAEGW